MENNIAVAIDIGTTKIYVIVAEIDEVTGKFQVKGYGTSTSKGMKKGLVVDVERTASDIKQAVKEAEAMSGIEIKSACIGVSGKHIESVLTSAEIYLGEKPRIILEEDYNKLIQVAKNKGINYDRRVLHEIAFNYRIDKGGIVKNPIGMQGEKLEADVHLITGSEKEIVSLKNALSSIDIEIEEIVLEPYASAMAVLTSSEKKFGTVIVDIGGGTTDIGIYRNEKLIYSSVIPIGGEHFTNDISYVLNIDLDRADMIKKEFSYKEKNISKLEEEEIVIRERNSFANRYIPLSELKEITDCRIDDILEQIDEKIQESGFSDYISNGIVFTGGSSQIAGLKERSESYFDKHDIKMGIPIEIEGLLENMNKPENSTGIGLLIYSVEKYTKEKRKKYTVKKTIDKVESKNGDEEAEELPFTSKIKDFFSNLF